MQRPRSKTYARVFDDREYTYETVGSFSLICDPATGVQQIPFHEDTIVVDIGGANTAGNKGWHKKGSYAILFGPESSYNSARLLPHKYEPNVQLLPLYATLVALRDLIPKIPFQPPPKTIVFKVTKNSDAQGFFDHITESVFTWADRDWKNSKGRVVGFGEQYKELHELIEEMEKKGVEVKFWAIHRELNQAVEEMAKRVIGVDGR
ncbi:hypothetical protein BDZ45DRAFT_166620 [Acephala macrosclerotiorum]|nr:hypothetical protein BDZ45DRAFT_166620 [Acephala macrosclerotiorum]